MTEAEMTLERLRSLLEAYGATPERWPAEERQPALALLARSPEARAARHAAAALDRLLDAVPSLAPSPALEGRILAGAPRPARRSRAARARAPRPGFPAWTQAAALLAPLMLGFALGFALAAGGEPAAEDELLDFALMTNGYTEYGQ